MSENPLETLLRFATSEPGRRPEFYRALLDADVLVMTVRDHDHGHATVLPAGSLLPVRLWRRPDGVDVLPFFSSVNALFEAVPQGTTCVAMPARDLFAMAKGYTFHLNPDCDYGCTLTPEDAAALLAAGTLRPPLAIDLATQCSLAIRQPKNPPQVVIAALIVLYARLPEVRAAYLVEVQGLEPEGAWSWLIVLDLEGDETRAINDTATVVCDAYSGPMTIDAIRMDPADSGWSQHLRETTKPFYERAWGARCMPSEPQAAGPS
jgi:hypothetical protein